jgi:IS1 family transposase
MKLGKDEKETRSKLKKMLQDNDVKMFWGAETRAYAERIIEEEIVEIGA